MELCEVCTGRLLKRACSSLARFALRLGDESGEFEPEGVRDPLRAIIAWRSSDRPDRQPHSSFSHQYGGNDVLSMAVETGRFTSSKV